MEVGSGKGLMQKADEGDDAGLGCAKMAVSAKKKG